MSDFDDCLKEKIKLIKPSAEILKTPVDINREASIQKLGSSYFLDGAKFLSATQTPLLSIIIGYFAMEHKACEILAKKGYKIKDHVCIIKAVSEVLKRRDLAKQLSYAYSERLNANYVMSFTTAEKDKEKTKLFLEDAIIFIEEMNKLG